MHTEKSLDLINQMANNKTTLNPIYKAVISIARSKENFSDYQYEQDRCDALEIDFAKDVAGAFPLIKHFYETLEIVKSSRGRAFLIKKQLIETAKELTLDQRNTTLNIHDEFISIIQKTAENMSVSTVQLLPENKNEVIKNYYEKEKPIDVNAVLEWLSREKPRVA